MKECVTCLENVQFDFRAPAAADESKDAEKM